MVSIKEAINALSDIQLNFGTKSIPLTDSLGYYMAEDIIAPIAVPNFNNAAMDGYAVCWEGEVPNTFKICGLIAAGEVWEKTLHPGEAIRIFTGAMVPKECTSVIQQEWAIEREGRVEFTQPIDSQRNIRLKGSQTQINQTVVSCGQKINSGIIGLLATLGIQEITVFNQVTASIIITGNELVEIGDKLPIAKIYNSNGPMLQSLFLEKGIRALPYTRCLDDPKALENAITSAIEHSPVIVLTGGISVGDFDFVKSVLDKLGVKEIFYKIKQKPGKPLYVGCLNSSVFIALPGNPASVNSCFHAWVNPFIQQLNGGPSVNEFYSKLPTAILMNNYHKKSGLTHFVKGNVHNGRITILTGQESFNLANLNVANSLVILPELSENIESGNPLSYIPFNS